MENAQRNSPYAQEMNSLQHIESTSWRPHTGLIDQTENTHLSFRNVEPVTIDISNLTVHIEPALNLLRKTQRLVGKGIDRSAQQAPQRKTILNGVTAQMPSGSLTAIIGASGSGKTFHPLRCFRRF